MKVEKSDSGSILIISLWVLGILSVLAVGIAFRLSLELRLSKYFMDKIEAEYLAKAGIFRALERIPKDYNGFDSMAQCGVQLKPEETLEGLFDKVPLGEGFFSVGDDGVSGHRVGIADEDGKININRAGQTVLAALLESAGGVGDESKAWEMAGNIMDWRDPDHASLAQNGSEGDYYENLPHPYVWADRDAGPVLNKDFRSLEELLLVKDMTPEIFNKIKNDITIFGNDVPIKVNINTAPKEVLAAMAMSVRIPAAESADIAGRIFDERSGEDRQDGTPDDRPFLEQDLQPNGRLDNAISRLSALNEARLDPNFKKFFKTYSLYYRIEAKGKINGSKAAAKLTVIVKKDPEGKLTFVYYHED